MNDQHSERDWAWELYCKRGVIVPEYASEIAARRSVQRTWGAEGERLR